MKKMLKTVLIGGAIYEGLNLTFYLGKAQMLGALAKYNVTGDEALDLLASDKRLRLKLISKVSTLVKRERSRE